MSAETDGNVDAGTGDDHECPTCGDDGFESRTGLKIHHSMVHDEPLEGLRECDLCGEEFWPRADSEDKYCSLECASTSRRDRVTLECEYCGDEIELPKSDAEGRRHCSEECRVQAQYDTRTCRMCGREFDVMQCRHDEFCGRPCFDEHRTDKPRPENLSTLVWLLFVYEDRELKNTTARVNAVRGPDEHYDVDDIRGQLVANGWLAPSLADVDVAPDELEAIVDEAEYLDEVADAIDESLGRTRRILRDIGRNRDVREGARYGGGSR
ncbi:zinc-finger domain protein [Halobacterium phage ChaoS9]|uniref:Zinc-finger domain protein n=1 Tax=Halobacterium phage ChaoS9 TaxID=2847105 RepID=A0A481V8I8_9CAUD|nr:HNH endonuclease [Halobacterium phage ChaoS9]QBI90079.1 zinc-finger domain protein [Halobacterium phage ChaoS9]